MAFPLSSVQLGIESQSFLPPMDLSTCPQSGQNSKEGPFMIANRSVQNNIPKDSYCRWNAYSLCLAAWCCAEHCPSREGILNVDSQVVQ